MRQKWITGSTLAYPFSQIRTSSDSPDKNPSDAKTTLDLLINQTSWPVVCDEIDGKIEMQPIYRAKSRAFAWKTGKRKSEAWSTLARARAGAARTPKHPASASTTAVSLVHWVLVHQPRLVSNLSVLTVLPSTERGWFLSSKWLLLSPISPCTSCCNLRDDWTPKLTSKFGLHLSDWWAFKPGGYRKENKEFIFRYFRSPVGPMINNPNPPYWHLIGNWK